ncbi:hypothetical protein [Nocardia asteroides]
MPALPWTFYRWGLRIWRPTRTSASGARQLVAAIADGTIEAHDVGWV